MMQLPSHHQGLEHLNEIDELALSFLSTRNDAMVRKAIKWSSVNTGSWNRQGLQDFSKILRTELGQLDAKVTAIKTPPIERISNAGSVTHFFTGPVIEARARKTAPVQVILTGHYDTVFPEGTFETVTDLQNGRINGPGLADMKGGIIVMIEALMAFEASPLKDKLGYHIVLTPDEETGNFASHSFLTTAAKAAQIGLTFEPAMESGAMSGGRKGSAIFDVIFRGRASHAGRNPEEGRSAINAAASFILNIEKLENCREGVTFNVGKLDGGGPNNIVPDLAIVRLGCRAPNQESAEWATESIDKALETVLKRDGISGEISGGFYRPPKPRNKAQSALFEATHRTGKALNLDLTFHDTGGVCEGNNVFAAGTPNIDTLGVRGGRIHSKEEFVVVDSFSERAKLASLLLNRLADGRIDAAHIKSLMNEN